MKNRENLVGGVGDYVNGVMHRGIHRGGGDKCVDSVDKLGNLLAKMGTEQEAVCDTRGGQRGQRNFKLATNCDYIHLGQLTQAKVSVSVGS